MPTQGRRLWPILLIVLLAVPGARAQVRYQIRLGTHYPDAFVEF